MGPEQVASSKEMRRIGLMSTVHGYRLYQQGHVTKRSCPTVIWPPPFDDVLVVWTEKPETTQKRLLKKRVRNKRKSKFKKKWGIKEE